MVTKSIANNSKEERFEALTFVLQGISYVPHYRNRKVFVGPGYGKHNFTRYSQDELLAMGAKPVTQMLWFRSSNGLVNESNP